jgi:membrane-bound serine protease (ClpP class)
VAVVTATCVVAGCGVAAGRSGLSLTVDRAVLDVALAVLTNPWIAGMLLWIGLLGVFVELKIPGFGFPGIAGATAFAVLFGSQYLVGHASPLEMLLLLVGLILIVFEVAVIPGFGVVGVAGIGCTLLALVLALQSGSLPDLRLPGARDAMLSALFSIALGFVGFGAGVLVLMRVLPEMPGLSRIVHTSDVSADAGFTTRIATDAGLLGRHGQALSDMRPAGKIQIGEQILDASTAGDYLDAGARVRVTRADGNRLLVEAVERS